MWRSRSSLNREDRKTSEPVNFDGESIPEHVLVVGNGFQVPVVFGIDMAGQVLTTAYEILRDGTTLRYQVPAAANHAFYIDTERILQADLGKISFPGAT